MPKISRNIYRESYLDFT